MTVAVCFTNFGPYHLARLRALADRLGTEGNRLVAYEVAGREQTYPWLPDRNDRTIRVDHFVPRPRLGDDRAGRLPASDGPGTRSRSARRALSGRVCASRVDGRGAGGPGGATAGDPAFRKPGHRPAPHLVERADQDAENHASSTRPWSVGRRTAITWCGSVCRPTASPWDTTRSTMTILPPRPRLARAARWVARACRQLPIS